MGFEKFIKRSGVPSVSLVKAGRMTFNRKAYDLMNTQHVELFFDVENKRVGIQPTPKTKNSYSISSISKTVTVHAFIKHIKLENSLYGLEMEHNKELGIYIIQL